MEGRCVMNKLLQIQQELKAPKDLYNSFGKYSYRSAESILQALKPLLKTTNTTLTISDDLVSMGDRYYVKATVTLKDTETDKVIAETTAYAREEADKKGMDGSQITGASSSYARKYALNGMFCIDDVKDSDATNTGEKTEEKPKETPKEDDRPVCPICGKHTTVASLKAWQCCPACKAKQAKEKASQL